MGLFLFETYEELVSIKCILTNLLNSEPVIIPVRKRL